MIERTITKAIRNSKKSILLLGPRQVGKSTLIKDLNPDLKINLSLQSEFIEFASDPDRIIKILSGNKYKTVFIDEIQRLPSLLNTIQYILDDYEKPPKFYLTGSSARKLRKGKANLLPGRVHSYYLCPITVKELNYKIDTDEVLSTGFLPGILTEKDKKERYKTLKSYASIYLKEEIQAEALTRNIEGFSRFLFIIAAESGKFLDISKISREAKVPWKTTLRYFEILEDTLVIKRCESFSKSDRRRLVQCPRFFFFDLGVLNALLSNFNVSQDRVGALFEHLIFNQIVHGAVTVDKNFRISSYRTEHGAEVDFIVELEGKVYAIEVKASKNIGVSDLRGFQSFKEFFKKSHKSYVAYLGNYAKKINDITILPWTQLIKELGL